MSPFMEEAFSNATVLCHVVFPCLIFATAAKQWNRAIDSAVHLWYYQTYPRRRLGVQGRPVQAPGKDMQARTG